VDRAVARSTSVDFFRGLALIIISVDHVPQSALAHLTLHTYTYCDAAEVFVFLGGAAFWALLASVALLSILALRAGTGPCAVGE